MFVIRENKIKIFSNLARVLRPLSLISTRNKAQQSGFVSERKKEGAECSFPGSYANRGNGTPRASSDAGKTKRKNVGRIYAGGRL